MAKYKASEPLRLEEENQEVAQDEVIDITVKRAEQFNKSVKEKYGREEDVLIRVDEPEKNK